MVDIHCHILPFIDDGASDWHESLDMARQAVHEGITTIVATPHHHRGRYVNPANRVVELVMELNERLAQEGIPLTVLPGQEIRIHRELLQELESGTIMGLANSRYLLIELPSNHCPDYTEEIFYELSLMNYVPVIAHPERNVILSNDLTQLASFINMGALAQITTHSLLGGCGKKIQKHTADMLQRNLAHFLASDAHGNGKRTFEYRNAFELVSKKYGPTYPDYFAQNASLLINNQLIYNAGGN